MNDVRNSIGWADFTWNPVTGCRRGCPYCYAKRLHDRFDPFVPFSNIEFHEGRLLDKVPRVKPSRIFVGSMSDIEYWSNEWTERIIDYCRQNKKHTFMFLSKNAWSYQGFNWPVNTMQGLTITKMTLNEGIDVVNMFDYPRPFLSIEPLLGNIYGNIRDEFGLVIVGAMTGPKPVIPKKEWIQSIKDHVPAVKIYWKKNIRKYL